MTPAALAHAALAHSALALVHTLASVAPAPLPSAAPATPVPTTLPAGAEVPEWAAVTLVFGLLLWAAAGLAVAGRARVWNPAVVAGPDRLPLGRSAWRLWVNGLAGFLTLLAASVALSVVVNRGRPTPPPAVTPATQPALVTDATEPGATVRGTGGPTTLPTTLPATPAARPPGYVENPAGTIIASAGAAAVALAVLLLLDRRLLATLGLTPARLPLGLGYAGLGVLAIFPVVFAATVATALARQALGYDLNERHPLLTALGETPRLAWLMVLAAGVIVPAFEELLFRGHLQTALAHAFARLGRSRGDDVPTADLAPPLGPIARPFTDDRYPPPDAPPDSRPLPPTHPDFYAVPSAEPSTPDVRPIGPAARWAAIGLTSVAFASLHPTFSIPIIFVFSICLGYLYERTGNLWATIIVHGTFNTMQTILFLLVSR